MGYTNPKFKTIVVTTDLNDAGSSALRYARAMARTYQSMLIIVHVIDPLTYAYPTTGSPYSTLSIAAQEELKRIEHETIEQGIAVHSVVESGIVCERILKVLKDHRADLLVLGTRAHSEVGRLALGTVARQLLTESHCPIMTISPDANATAPPWSGCWPRVLAATDFSPASLEALRYAHQVALRQLIVLHVSTNQQDYTSSQQKVRHLAPFDQSHTVSAEHLVVSGDPAERIVEYAQRYGVSLVALGAPQNMFSERALKKSTVQQVIAKVRCPVLCFPSGDVSPTQEVAHHSANA